MKSIEIKQIIDIDINTQQTKSSIKEYSGYVKFNKISKFLRYSSRQDEENCNLYQRPTDHKRVTEIVEFLEKHYNDKDETKILPFPTPVTLSIDSEILTDKKIIDLYLDKDKNFNPDNFFDKNKDINSVLVHDCLYINGNYSEIIFIVDGQHRINAIEEFTKKYNQEIYLYFTLLVNYDLAMQAKIFANINFKVKPVNKSLFYDIFGSLPNEYNELTFAHMLVKRINKDENIGKLIKMLGNGSGTVSLAFIVETIIDTLIKYNKKKDSIPPKLNNIYNIYIDDSKKFKDKYAKLGIFFIEYFKFIKENFKTFPVSSSDGSYSSFNYKNILTKTTGIFSLIKLLNEFDIEYILENYNTDLLKSEFTRVLLPIQKYEKELFGSESPYKGSGGKGHQKDLYNDIKEIMDTGKLKRVDNKENND